VVDGDSSESPVVTIGNHSVTRINKQSGDPEIVTVDYVAMNETENTDNIDNTMDRQLPGIPKSQDDRRQACDLSSRFPSSYPLTSPMNPGKLTDGANNDIHGGAIQSQVQASAQELANEQGERSL
jgi:hypothetical protein